MTLPPTAPPGDEPPPPVRRGKRKASPAPAQEVVKPYIEFEPPGMAIKPPWALGFLTLFSEAHEWQQLLRRAEPEAQLKAEEPGRSSTVDPVTEACWQMDAAVDRLIPAMMEGGNAQAAEALIKTASHMTLVLQMMYNLRPELFHHWAATTSHIPVLASLKPSWLPLARKNLVALKVGSRKAAAEFKSLAYDERHVCRAWARRAVETMDRKSGGDPAVSGGGESSRTPAGRGAGMGGGGLGTAAVFEGDSEGVGTAGAADAAGGGAGVRRPGGVSGAGGEHPALPAGLARRQNGQGHDSKHTAGPDRGGGADDSEVKGGGGLMPAN